MNESRPNSRDYGKWGTPQPDPPRSLARYVLIAVVLGAILVAVVALAMAALILSYRPPT